MHELLANVRVVLCRPSHPGNIGASARAMKTMGLRDLRLVAPLHPPDGEARALAAGALDVLERARTEATLGSALAGCVDSFGFSARPREWSPQTLDLRACAARAIEAAARGPVALVFGNERSGLTNDELLACRALVHIPADPAYSSLNLAQAVQLACYELRLAAGACTVPPGRTGRLATEEDLASFYAYLDRVAGECGFYTEGSGSRLPERWRRLFSRIPAFEREELNILRGLLEALRKDRS